VADHLDRQTLVRAVNREIGLLEANWAEPSCALVFWLLKEAETHGGQSFGPIGGRIVPEVLVGLAENDPSSFLRAQPDWKPTLGTQPGEFTIADLLTIAGVAL
jgi:hypothetical protein